MLACIACRIDGATLFYSGMKRFRIDGADRYVAYWQRERQKAVFFSSGSDRSGLSVSRVLGNMTDAANVFQQLQRNGVYHFTNRPYTFTTSAPFPIAQSVAGNSFSISYGSDTHSFPYTANREQLPPLSVMLSGWTPELDPDGVHSLEMPLAIHQFDYNSARFYAVDAVLERCPDCNILCTSDGTGCNCDPGTGDPQHPNACRPMRYTAPRSTGLEDISFGLELEVLYCPNYHELSRKTVFKSKTDGSIGSSSGREFVSTILRGSEGVKKSHEFLDMANERKWRIDRTCGFHLHIGIGDFTAQQTVRTIAAFRCFEPIFFAMVPESRRSNTYCRKCSWTWGHALDAEALGSWQYLADNSGERYRWLNLMSLSKYGTIENRLHGGTLDPYKIEGWIRLNTEITYHAASTDRSVMDWITIDREFSPDQKLGELFKLLRPATVKFVKKRLSGFKVLDPKARTIRGYAKVIKEPIAVSAETNEQFGYRHRDIPDDGE